MRSVGLQEIGYSARVPYGGGGSIGVLMHAAAAVAAGVADVVVAYRAVRARSGATRFGGAKVAANVGNTHAGTTAMQWCTPHGVLTPASWMALNATRYMHQYGVTSEDFGRAVVQLRAYAATNPDAWGYERPMTLADHQASRWIAEPCIRMFDCCQETDGVDRAGHHEPRTRGRDAATARRDRGRRPAPGSSSRRSRPTTTGPTWRSWSRPSCSPGACSTTPDSAATRSTSR